MRIANYIKDDKVSVKDKLIGSDGDKTNKTKNFSITGISDFILGQLKNSGVVFRYSDGTDPEIAIGEPGYFFSEGGATKPEIVKFYFSVDSYFGEELAELFASVGSNLGELYLGLSQQDDSANYGFFNVVNIVAVGTDYYAIDVEIRGNMFAKTFVDGKNYSLFFDLASSSEFDVTIEAGVFKLFKNGALHKSVDMSVYLDDTNLARLVSGTVDEFGMATFTRDDATTFQVDFGNFLSGITPTKTSQLTNDGEDGTSPFVTRANTYNKSEVDNKDSVIQQQVTKLNGLYLERDTSLDRINLKDSTGTILSWITDSNIDGVGYSIEFDADTRTIYILDSQGEIADTVPMSILVNDKLDKGGYPGTAQTLKDLIDAINAQPLTSPETEIKEFNEGHISGYDYNVTAKWVFGGTPWNATQPITLDPADPVYDRIDLFVVDNAGNISKITGTPSANPVEPSYDPNTQIKAKFIQVLAGSTAPAEVSKLLVYDENTQVAGGEYNTSENTAGVRIILGSATSPFSGTKSIEGTSLLLQDTFTLTPGSPVSVIGVSSISYRIKNKPGVYSPLNPLSVRLKGTQNNGKVGYVYLAAAWQFGYNKSDTATYQFVSIPFPDKMDIVDITAISFVNNVSAEEGFGYWIDAIKLSTGETNTGGSGVDQAYVDQQDAAVLAAAKQYADDQDAVNLQTAKDYADSVASGGDPTIDFEYPTIADMIAGQNSQLEDDIIKVLDASADPKVGSGKAYYFYDGTVAGTIDDYTLLTKEEISTWASKQYVDDADASLQSQITDHETRIDALEANPGGDPSVSEWQHFSGDGSQSAFTVTGEVTGVIIVEVDGRIQKLTTDYSVSGSTITFTSAPYNGATIGVLKGTIAPVSQSVDHQITKVSYVDTPTFNLGSTITEVVTVDVIGASRSIFEAENSFTGTTITINETLASGDVIRIWWR